MAKKTGRKSAYETKIKPHFPEILQMCESMTDKQIADSLGVAYSTFLKYKAEKKEFAEVLKKGRQKLVSELKSVLIKRAKGYDYEEKKIITDSDGYTRKEIYQRHSRPDVASINLLLKNYDRENWSNDWQNHEIKLKELELKQKSFESENW